MTRTADSALESFDPTMFKLFLKGGHETIRIEFKTYGKAVRFRQRLHTLRRIMRRENHEHYKLVERCRISILWGEKAGYEPVEELVSEKKVHWPKFPDKTPCIVQLQPRDLEFQTEMASYAHLVEDIPIPIPAEGLIPNSDGPAALEEIMKQFHTRKEDNEKS